MRRHETDFVAFAMHPDVLDSTAVLDVANLEPAEFFTAQAVIEKDRQDSAVAFAFEGRCVRRIKQGAGLTVADRRRLAFVCSLARAFYAIDGIVRDRIALAQMIKQ